MENTAVEEMQRQRDEAMAHAATLRGLFDRLEEAACTCDASLGFTCGLCAGTSQLGQEIKAVNRATPAESLEAIREAAANATHPALGVEVPYAE